MAAAEVGILFNAPSDYPPKIPFQKISKACLISLPSSVVVRASVFGLDLAAGAAFRTKPTIDGETR
jgi:hypothetical protein